MMLEEKKVRMSLLTNWLLMLLLLLLLLVRVQVQMQVR
jgi:hypothetical protein